MPFPARLPKALSESPADFHLLVFSISAAQSAKGIPCSMRHSTPPWSTHWWSAIRFVFLITQKLTSFDVTNNFKILMSLPISLATNLTVCILQPKGRARLCECGTCRYTISGSLRCILAQIEDLAIWKHVSEFDQTWAEQKQNATRVSDRIQWHPTSYYKPRPCLKISQLQQTFLFSCWSFLSIHSRIWCW